MRASEILQEDHNDQLKSDLDNLLLSAKGTGASEINTVSLLQQLRNMGHSTVNQYSIMPLLTDNASVINATPQMITISNRESSDDNLNSDSAEKVTALAKKAAKKSAKKGNLKHD
jgi:hypothetical protein